jgi:hypothetical protein
MGRIQRSKAKTRRGPKPVDVTLRFWRYVSKGRKCWTWIGVLNENCYGRITVRHGSTILAHRLSWIIHHGPIPHGMWVCHTCDNPPCVNPAHLFLGDARSNHDDMVRKGRRFNRPHKTHCPSGHPYSGENILIDNEGFQSCRTCRKIVSKRCHAAWYQLNKESVKAKVKAWKAKRSSRARRNRGGFTGR